MDMSDLIYLNQLVVKMIKHKRTHLAWSKSQFFMEGDKVSFQSSKFGKSMEGILERKGRVNAIVKTAEFSRFRVPYVMLELVAKGK